ncbi:MAG: hypothetical protein JO057_12410, partial [Chloroflexi bacterium]|nr:hypothetical protein [Chloroflexota bacterium]
MNNIPLLANKRFITFSVDVAAANCFANHPLLQFSLLDSLGTATPVGSQIDGCTSPTAVTPPACGVNGPLNVQVCTYTSNGALLFSGSWVGVRLVNNQPSGNGNDHPPPTRRPVATVTVAALDPADDADVDLV